MSDTPLLDIIRESQQRTLTAHDRCDRCGAQAYVRAKILAGGELLFCAHHGTEHQSVLDDPDRVEVLDDERQRLVDEAEALFR